MIEPKSSQLNSNPKPHVGVIFGGRSGEHEVSLMSARSVLDALDRDKYIVTEIAITHDGDWLVGENVLTALQANQIEGLQPAAILPTPQRGAVFAFQKSAAGQSMALFATIDVVFPVLHGSFGEDGTLQGLLEMAGVAYVGAGVLGSSLGMDKGVFKDVMVANHIPVAEGVIALRTEIESDMEAVIARVEAMAPYPVFTKPANMGSSVGVSKCRNRSDLLEGLMEAARFDRRILIERGLDAREIEVSVLGNDDPAASIPGEVRPAAEFYTYNAKYHDDRSELFIPAPIPEAIAEQAREYAIRAYRLIDCAGMARVDFLLEVDTHRLYLNEVNTIPGFTHISMYPKLWEASGLPYPKLVDRLIELALERRAQRDRTETRYQR